MSTTSMDAVGYDLRDGIVTLTIDDPSQGANTMNRAYVESMEAAVSRVAAAIEHDADAVSGVVVTSGKKTFFAGGDLKILVQSRPEDAADLFVDLERIKATLRRLETLGKPVVAAINGAALGGGLEIALACHHRIAVDGGYDIGLPESTLGLLPGGGGITRTVRMLGLQTALTTVLLEGKRFRPSVAKDVGLVDDVVATQDALLPAARSWIAEHASDPAAATQPWDAPGYRMPGGTPSSPGLAAILPAFPSTLRKQLKGAPFRAQRSIMAAAVEGAQVDVDTASRIESRYLVDLLVGQQFKNMTQAFFFDMNAISAGASRPPGIPTRAVTRLAVVGAGMMGAGIAYVAARAGTEVVLLDVSAEAAQKGKEHSATLLGQQVDKGRMTTKQRDEVLARIHPTASYADLAGCDAVVEAVFESVELKHQVMGEVEPVVAADALLGSNTSTLPITVLARGVRRADDFIGIHFFSPVDRMPLVEVIVGEQTSDEAIARALDFAKQIRKTPIVVNDSRGFFTSRVYGTLVLEGAQMLAEGVDPVTIERAASLAGFPGQPLAMLDELSLTLPQKIDAEARKAAEAEGREHRASAGMAVIDALVAQGRKGKAAGAGFYEYPERGTKFLWPGLWEQFVRDDVEVPLVDVKERLTFVMSLESIRCLDEGVLRTVPDANVGSILGIGFPPVHGGVLQYARGYEAADGRIGLAAFADRASELAAAYGERFTPPARLAQLLDTSGPS